jgi:ribose transport system substrate-binding protein
VVLVPMGKAALAGPTERAEAQGVPVILCASGVDTERYHTLVTRDLMAAGQENGEWLARKLGAKGNVIVVDGIAGNDTSETLGKAIRTVLEKYPDIRVVNQGYSDFSVTKAKQFTESVIASGVQIDGAWGSGGEAVTGIMQAFVDANKPVPPVAGGTAQNGALRIAREQKSEYAGWQFPAAISKACLEVAVRTLGGERLPKFIDVIELLPEARNFYTEDIDRYYRPEYSDDYVAGSDQYLSREDLAALNLIR